MDVSFIYHGWSERVTPEHFAGAGISGSAIYVGEAADKGAEEFVNVSTCGCGVWTRIQPVRWCTLLKRYTPPSRLSRMASNAG